MEVEHHFSGGVYAKQCIMQPGIKYEQHIHNFDHMSILSSGTALIEVDGVEKTLNGPTVINVEAGKVHSVTPLTEIVWFCIHKTDETNPDNIDETLIHAD